MKNKYFIIAGSLLFLLIVLFIYFARAEYFSFELNGKKVSYLGGSCLPNKPTFLDEQGNIHANYCFGKDLIVGTSDDCGCSFGNKCQQDGSCFPVCSDGTLPEQCSEEKPLYCTNEGNLVLNATQCGCSADEPIVLPNGDCSYEVLLKQTNAQDFLRGENKGIKTSKTAFNNLAYGKQVSSVSGKCNSFLTDGEYSLHNNTYNKYCTAFAGDAYTIDLGGIKEINQIVVYFGYPYVLEYYLEYTTDGTTWKMLKHERNNFNFATDWEPGFVFKDKPSYFGLITGWNFPGYRENDKGALIVVYDNRNEEGTAVGLFETYYNNEKYQSIQQRISFEPIEATKIRFRPVVWQQNAKIYEIEVYNKNAGLRLDKTYSKETEEMQFVNNGIYESDILLTGGKPESTIYSNLYWELGSQRLDNSVISATDRTPKYFIKKIPQAGINGPFGDKGIVFDAATNSYSSSIQSSPFAGFMDFDYGNDLGYKYYGLYGDAPYEASRYEYYEGNGNVNYSKACINDGFWAGKTSPVTKGKCVYAPAVSVFRSSALKENQVLDSLGNPAVKKGININLTEGVKNKAMEFNGENEYVELRGFSLGESTSISLWLKSDDYNRIQGTIPFSIVGGGRSIYNGPNLFFTDQKISWNIGDGAINAFSNSAYPNSEWHHFVIVNDKQGNKAELYIDGNKAGEASYRDTRIVNGNIRIGSWYGDAYYFKGSIDEVKIYNKSLSANEIGKLYNLQGSSLSDKLVSYFSFDESSFKKPNVEEYDYTQVLYHYRTASPRTIDRIKLSELKNRIYKVCVGTDTQIIECFEKDTNEVEYNVTTIFDISSPVKYRILFIDLYTYKEKLPLVWELATYETTKRAETPLPVSNYDVKLQFRSGKTKEEVEQNAWYGAEGVIDGYFTNSGQVIGEIHNGKPWFQYKVIASTPDVNNTPLIDELRIGFAGTRSKPPQAVVLSDKSKVIQGESVYFDGRQSKSGQGRIDSYEWSFSDGSKASGINATHTFEEAGTHYACLSVIDRAGAEDVSCVDIRVEIFDCLTPDSLESNEIFPMQSPIVQSAARDALREYADKRGILVSDINSAEEIYQAALEYLKAHMSYLSAEKRQTCSALTSRWSDPGAMSLPIIMQYTKECGCPEGAQFCGFCTDYSVMFTTLTRAMGVNSKCVYSATTARLSLGETRHAYNVINYNGKFRIIEPQAKERFSFDAMSWTNEEGTPFYLTGAILNDKYSDWGATRSTNLGSVGADTKERVMNYLEEDGLPDRDKECDSSGFTAENDFSTQRNLLFPWDPASLFAEVCP